MRQEPSLEPLLGQTGVGSGPVPKWILVAEDYDAIRELWTTVLGQAGYRVLGARNGREALDLIRTVVPDLVTLDLRMPEMDGPAFLQALASSPGLRRIPVLIVSGFLGDESFSPSLGLNIVGRVSKPLRPAELVAAVQAALQRSGAPSAGVSLPSPR
ncbi:MAG TPA: response regulator [Solirubrobacterales bacterium]|nr:response regulator [Solirubrobacterales bacterium]